MKYHLRLVQRKKIARKLNVGTNQFGTMTIKLSGSVVAAIREHMCCSIFFTTFPSNGGLASNEPFKTQKRYGNLFS